MRGTVYAEVASTPIPNGLKKIQNINNTPSEAQTSLWPSREKKGPIGVNLLLHMFDLI